MGWGIFILWAEALVPIFKRWETMQPTRLFSAYDESGDFGEYDYRAPFYIISMVIWFFYKCKHI